MFSNIMTEILIFFGDFKNVLIYDWKKQAATL